MNLYEILQNSDRVGEGMTHFERLFAQKVGGGKINEISGVPPLRYIGNGNPLTDYLISGNTVQDGTPSPDAPVDAMGCGVRTGNIINPTDMMDGYFINPSGVIEGSSRRTTTPIIAVNGTYMTLTYSTNLDRVFALYALFSNGTMTRRLTGIASGEVINISQADSICVSFYSGNSQVYVQSAELQIQLAYGSAALPYEPYGYKLPLTVNGTEHPVYLGQVETTRRVKKRVLDGTEDWRISGSGDSARFYINIADAFASSSLYCTHFTNGVQTTSGNCEITGSKNLVFNNSGIATTTSNWKTWLSTQYAAGTPVTVWYVLAEPETAIVNEPLMKIGDYADTISFAQAGVTIPTVNGENVLDVPTEVPPSEVWIRGKIKEV
jgi:hypothetical protein